MRDALEEALPRLWRHLPLVLVASAPAALAAMLAGAAYLTGGLLLLPLVTVLLLGPAWQLLAAVCAALIRDDPPRVSGLPRLLAAGWRTGTARAVPLAVTALLATASLAVANAGPPVWRLPLAVNLVTLGSALLVAPFAYATGSWRRGAAVAAASPPYVGLLLAFLAMAGILAWALGPPLLVLAPPVVALCTAALSHRFIPAPAEVAR